MRSATARELLLYRYKGMPPVIHPFMSSSKMCSKTYLSRTGVRFRVEQSFRNRGYYLVDATLTWDEAKAKCAENGAGYLAEADSVEKFNFLKGMLDAYRTQGGSAVGAWIDGKYDSATSKWQCASHQYHDIKSCSPDMPGTWQAQTSGCIRLLYSTTSGVVTHSCTEKMPAICAKYR